ncbi:hypothetical protein RDI58_021987 [Solanum bulbocastanum]|uniref:Uncharacterized protein n=1 Tax=Solanum bulbocastanum TaxID=147425 RepID=A0AAN8Y7N5_SOLBU
MVAAITEW